MQIFFLSFSFSIRDLFNSKIHLPACLKWFLNRHESSMIWNKHKLPVPLGLAQRERERESQRAFDSSIQSHWDSSIMDISGCHQPTVRCDRGWIRAKAAAAAVSPPLTSPHKRKSLTPANLVQTIQTWHSAPLSESFFISFGCESERQGMLVQGTWRRFEICPGSLPVTRRGRGSLSVPAEKYSSISTPLRLTCQHVHQRHKSMCAVVTCGFDDSWMSPFLPQGCQQGGH